MKEELPTPLHELIYDRDAAWIEQQLMAHIRGVERQGMPPRTIARALARVLFSYCTELYSRSLGSRIWIKKFMQQTGRDFIEEEELTSDLEELIDLRTKVLKNTEPFGSA